MKRLAILCCLFGSLFVYANSTTSRVGSRTQEFLFDQPSDSLSITRGGELFGSRCFTCHSTYISHAYDTEGWNTILTRMSANAGLDSTQSLDLKGYVFNQLANTDSTFMIRTVGGYQQW